MRDAFRVARGIFYADRRALRQAEQREAFEAQRVDHRFEIGDQCLEGQVADIPVGQAVGALVIADKAEIFGQAANHPAP